MSELESRLAVYGTLAPGRSNAHILAPLKGTWRAGTVRGRLHPEGWGMTEGYPAIILDDAGDDVAVQIFESADLPAHWPRIDDFEGDGYRRVPVAVTVSDETLTAYIYELAEKP